MRLVTRVLIVDDSPWRRNPRCRLLAMTTDLEIGGVIATLPELVQACLTCQPHVLILGGGLKPFAFDLPSLIAQLSPSTKIIAVLNAQDPIRTQALFITKLQGALFQHELDEAFLHGIRLVAAGKTWFTRSVLLQLGVPERSGPPQGEQAEAGPSPALTQRDRQILACLRRGEDNAQIAATLGLADQTVRNYVAQVCKKLGVTRQALQPPPQIKG